MKTLKFIILSFIICISNFEAQTIEPVKVGLNIGNIAPELDFQNPQGENIKLSSLRISCLNIFLFFIKPNI